MTSSIFTSFGPLPPPPLHPRLRIDAEISLIMPRARQFSFSLFPKFLLPPTVSHRPTASRGDEAMPSDAVPESFAEKRRPRKYLDGHISYLRCSRCGVDLCLTSQIISKGFTGRHGRAFLVSPEPAASAVSVNATSSATDSLPNTAIQKPVPRQLVTGAHTVSDISCAFCGSVLGWKYVAAEEESQRYKVGKSILETKRVTASSCWETLPSSSGQVAAAAFERSSPRSVDEDVEVEEGGAGFEDIVEFDSQDEDECEDLFAGIWSPGLAAARRNRKFEHRTGIFGLS